MTSITPVWFITAASSGFGHEIALIALKRGHKVIATARNPSRIQDLADAGADTLAFDVTAPLSDIEAIAKNVFAKHGRVDYLINAAGFILEGAVEEVSPQEVYDSFNTNVFGTMNTIRAFLPGMRAQDVGANGTRGTVATFGSLGSWKGGPGFSVYAMTKACASSLAESLRTELAPFSIVATVIEPGYFRTNFLNPNVRSSAALRIDAYEDEKTPTGHTRRALEMTDGKQPGDVKKGCQVLVDVLTKSGIAEGRDVPVRVVLGSDCEKFIRDECDDTLALLDEWKEIAKKRYLNALPATWFLRVDLLKGEHSPITYGTRQDFIKVIKMKTIGFLGGMSYHSTILYYRHINAHVQRKLGSPHAASLILRSFNFADIAPLFTANKWPAIASRFIEAGNDMKASGAQALAIGCNIGHRVAAEVSDGTGLPVLHIADAVASLLGAHKMKKVGLLATRAVMEDEFIKTPLREDAGVEEVLVPGIKDRERLDRAIFTELASGEATDATKTWMNGLVKELVDRGAEGIVLACTDLQFVIEPQQAGVPVFDTLELHAKYVVEWSMRDS
ncbi:Fc.00g024560.m01.CDS01 [Cosmosporella sp. VM-42]